VKGALLSIAIFCSEEEEFMGDQLCCVCGKASTKAIGQRAFCDEHYESATHQRKGVWRSVWGQVIALVVFVVLVYAAEGFFKPVLGQTALVIAGVILAVVPALIWLAFFYQQDRLEPEPKSYIASVFILAMLVAAAIWLPLSENVFRISKWLYADTLTTILGGILLVGFIQEFLKYASVRYSVYRSAEFDEPTDGIVYATAAGLGFATVLNIHFVIANGGVDLGTGVIRIAIVSLAQASFAGITGYFLGRAKFESEPLWWMPAGLTLAAVLNGLFFWLRTEITQSTITLTSGGSNPWYGLILAAVLAGGTAAALAWLIRRNINSALKA
jgi:RsiW-degrading membrane proteinase PrsW (M82 family)